MAVPTRTQIARLVSLAVLACAAGSSHAAFEFVGMGSLDAATDLSGLTGTLENGNAANILGGMGSGFAWAGGNAYLALPDRGPNASSYTNGALVDNTTSYIARFNTVTMAVNSAPSTLPTGMSVPYTVTPTLQSTTLLWSSTPLNYGSTAGLASGVPTQNTAGKYYFTGRSDGFAAGSSSNPNNARLDPESIRVSADGKSVFISDEYGPYVYQFNRQTGERTRTFSLPSDFAIANQNALGATEISGNASGRVTNKGMEGLAISPDGRTLYGIMQSALIQDGGDKNGKTNRIVQIDIASGAVKEFAVSNLIGSTSYNNSELIAINDHTLAFLPRDGKGLGDGTSAAVKQVWAIDLSKATSANDVTGLSADGTTRLFTGKQLLDKAMMFDIAAMLRNAGFSATDIPSKLEGIAFGPDVDGYHIMYVTNDNDFVPGTAGGNRQYVFRFKDSDLNAITFSNGQSIGALQMQAVPEPATFALGLSALAVIGGMARRRRA